MSKIQNLRNNHKVRIIVIAILMLLVVYFYFRNVNFSNLGTGDGIKSELGQNYKPDTWEKKGLLGIFAILGAALGMEVSNTDFDVKKLIDTKGDLKASRVMRDKEGNIVNEADVASGTKVGKYTDEYDCKDFKTQSESQKFFNNAGGIAGDTNRLDGNKDGIPCQALPAK